MRQRSTTTTNLSRDDDDLGGGDGVLRRASKVNVQDHAGVSVVGDVELGRAGQYE